MLFLYHKKSIAEIRALEKARIGSKRMRKEVSATKIFRNIAQKTVEFDDYVDSLLDDPASYVEPHRTIQDFTIRTREVFVTPILDEIASLFTILSKKKCGACIKIRTVDPSSLSSGNERFTLVSTWARDKQSQVKRPYDTDEDKGLHSYRHSRNTAFNTIIESRKIDYWAHDDLTSLGQAYVNINDERASLYNATAVQGLRHPLSEVNEPDGIIGFICIDNKNGSLDNKLSEHILGILSCSVYNIMRKFSGMEELLIEVLVAEEYAE